MTSIEKVNCVVVRDNKLYISDLHARLEEGFYLRVDYEKHGQRITMFGKVLCAGSKTTTCEIVSQTGLPDKTLNRCVVGVYGKRRPEAALAGAC